MSLSVTYVSKVTILETLTGDFVDPANATVGFNGLDLTETLTGATTVPVTKHAEDTLAMTAGAATINLAALPGKTAEETVVGTGLKVQYLKIVNPITNANSITVSKGASNGYGLNAAGTTWSVPLSPGQEFTFRGNDSAPDIAAGARTIDVAGTGTQSVEYVVVMG